MFKKKLYGYDLMLKFKAKLKNEIEGKILTRNFKAKI